MNLIFSMKNSFFTLPKYFLFIVLLLISITDSFSQNQGPVKSDTVLIKVDMSFMVSEGQFHPLTDTIELEGTMNPDTVKKMEHSGSGNIYSLTYFLPVNGLYSYKFRIHKIDTIHTTDSIYAKDTVYYESADPSTRYIRIGDSTQTITNYYNNYHPGWIPMVFDCDMYYQIRSGKFSPAIDYLDISGNFNNWGADRIELFPRSSDSIYSFTIYYDTASIPLAPFKFKYRFNGDTATMELKGDSNRVYYMTVNTHHTFCWYNNLDPNVPALPFVYDVVINESTIEDSIVSRRIFTGAYNYEDYNLKLEGKSLYQWYSADSTGGTLTPIDSAWYINYIIFDTIGTDSIKNNLFGKYLVFEVTPVTIDSITGLPGYAWSATRIFPVGIRESEPPSARIYPNPVDDILNVEFFKPVKSAELTDIMGKRIFYQDIHEKESTRINVRSLDQGIYLLKLNGILNSVKIYKIIRQ